MTVHYYCGADAYRLGLEDVVLTENYRVLRKILRVNALIRAYNPRRDVYQLDTEWGLACDGPDGTGPESARRNANIVGTLHRAVRLIYYVREGMLRGASGWEMFCRLKQPGFGFLSRDAPKQAMMLYWLYYHFNRHVGRWAVGLSGTAPYHTPAEKQLAGPITPVLATLSADGKTVYLVIANGSAGRAVPCDVTLDNFRPRSATGVTLTQSDLDAHPLVQRKEDAVSELPVKLRGGEVGLVVPARSVVFITIRHQKPDSGR